MSLLKRNLKLKEKYKDKSSIIRAQVEKIYSLCNRFICSIPYKISKESTLMSRGKDLYKFMSIYSQKPYITYISSYLYQFQGREEDNRMRTIVDTRRQHFERIYLGLDVE